MNVNDISELISKGVILDLREEMPIKGYQQKMNWARRNRKKRLQNNLEYKNQEERENIKQTGRELKRGVCNDI